MILFFASPAYAAVDLSGVNHSIFKYVAVICLVVIAMGIIKSRLK